METNKLKFTTLQNEIFRLLCRRVGKGINQREIAQSLNVSPTAVGKALKGLKGFVKVSKTGKMNLTSVELNRAEGFIIQLKRVENLKQVYESGLADYLEGIYPGATMVLFGSYSLGEDTIKSDIDIAVLGVREKKVSLGKFERFLERTININYYKDQKKINKNLKENILNGIVIHGMIGL
ncbi:nucleotidyltransferase domain-containing protein [Nanoarchaeota archaeon]